VSYNDKHNEANGEGNRDGDNSGRSWNCGVEGPTDDAEINRLRRRQQRNFLATLFLSQGVPMLCAGDEYGRSQKGNNNAYCQDNELSWLAWDRPPPQQQQEVFTARLIHFRHTHPIFRRPKFFHGRKIRGVEAKDLLWFNADGSEMTDEHWNRSFIRCIGVVLVGFAEDIRDYFGKPIHDDTFMLLFNAHHEPVNFVIPGREKVSWERVIDTDDEAGFLAQPTTHHSGDELPLVARSMSVFKLSAGSQEHARATSWKLRPAVAPTAPAK
jgi:glycogen operon protein